MPQSRTPSLWTMSSPSQCFMPKTVTSWPLARQPAGQLPYPLLHSAGDIGMDDVVDVGDLHRYLRSLFFTIWSKFPVPTFHPPQLGLARARSCTGWALPSSGTWQSGRPRS